MLAGDVDPEAAVRLGHLSMSIPCTDAESVLVAGASVRAGHGAGAVWTLPVAPRGAGAGAVPPPGRDFR
jgi:hypothetical protein